MHLEKITNNTEHARVQHNSRKKLSKTSNDKIDPTRSHLNYNLTKSDIPEMKKFKQRLSELSYRKQKNNVRMEEIIITAPKNLTDSKDLEKFFVTAYEELKKQCGGSKNEISAWVHMDETSPHLHYLFIPGIEVNGIEKLSASKLFNRQKLQQLHPSMQKAIDSTFGHHNYIVVADDPDERQQTSDNLKTFKKKKDMIDKLETKISNLQAKDSDLQLDIQINEVLNKMQEDKKQQLKTECDNLQTEQKKLTHNVEQLQHKNNAMQIQYQKNFNELDQQGTQINKNRTLLDKQQTQLDEKQQQLTNIDNILQQKCTEFNNIIDSMKQQLAESGYKDKITLDLMYEKYPEFVEEYQNKALTLINQHFELQQNEENFEL